MLCQVCGNDIEAGAKRCPYCESTQDAENINNVSRVFYQKTVNIEQGYPTVAEALGRLDRELTAACQEKIRLLTLIHGYGSSGKGGVIRLEIRRSLDYLCSRGEIALVIYGEDFGRRNGPTRNLLGRYPELAKNPYLNQKNKGITLVLIY